MEDETEDDATHIINFSARVHLPRVPNYLIVNEDRKIPVGEISEPELRRIGEAWTDALVARSNGRI